MSHHFLKSLSCIVLLSLMSFTASGQDIKLPSLKDSDVQLIGAKTYSEKHIGGVGAKSGNRARIVQLSLRFPKRYISFSFDSPETENSLQLFTLQDSGGKNYLPVGDASGNYGRDKKGVFRLYWICPYIEVPNKERKSLRFKGRLYLGASSSSNNPIATYLLDIPVTCFS